MGWIHGDERVDPFVGSAGSGKSSGPLPPRKVVFVSEEQWKRVLHQAVEDYIERWGEPTEDDATSLMGWFEKKNAVAELHSFLVERGWQKLTSVTEITVALDLAMESLAPEVM